MSTEIYITTARKCPKIEEEYIGDAPTHDNSCLDQPPTKEEHSNCRVHFAISAKAIATAIEENQILVMPANTLQVPNCQNGIQLI